ncbi:hypothetical protein BH11BAC5_BH11BAC5_38080 [soil metagenome]
MPYCESIKKLLSTGKQYTINAKNNSPIYTNKKSPVSTKGIFTGTILPYSIAVQTARYKLVLNELPNLFVTDMFKLRYQQMHHCPGNGVGQSANNKHNIITGFNMPCCFKMIK